MIVGLVKWFDKEKGYGVVKSTSEEEAFLHKNEFIIVPEKVGTTTALIYETKSGRIGRLEAIKARPPESYKDWELIMSSLGSSDSVSIEIEVSGHGRLGRPFMRKETRQLSIRGYAGYQLLKKKSRTEIISFLTRYYKEVLVPEKPQLFYNYVKFVRTKVKEIALPDSNKIIAEIYSFFGTHKNNIVIFCAWINDDPFVLNYLSDSQLSFEQLLGLKKANATFPTHDLTTSLFRDAAFLVNEEHVLKIKPLPGSDIFLSEIFSLRLTDLLNSKSLGDYFFLVKLIDNITDTQIKSQCNLSLSKVTIFIEEITDDKILVDICARFCSESVCEAVLNRWNHQNAGLTLSLLAKIVESNYTLSKIEKPFFIRFSNSASIDEVKKLLSIYNTPFIISKLIQKIDFIKSDPSEYLKGLHISEENITLLNEKLTNLINDIASNFNYSNLRKAVTLINELGPNLFSIELKNKIERFSIERFPDELNKVLTNEKLLTPYNFWNAKEVYRRCKECLFSEDLKQQVNEIFVAFILRNGNKQVIILAWKDEYLPSFIRHLFAELSSFSNEDLELVFATGRLENSSIQKIVEERMQKGNNSEWVLRMAFALLDDVQFKNIDKAIFENTAIETYFIFWKKGLGKIIPTQYIITLLSQDSTEIYQVHNWVKDRICEVEQINPILFLILDQDPEVTDRKVFYLKLRCIKCLVDLDSKNQHEILSRDDDFNKLILWFLELHEALELNILQRKFIYFNPADQVKIIKRLFYLKHQGKISFSIVELDAILRADVDLFRLNEKFNDDFVLDISTSLVIELIKNYEANNRFLADSELLKLVLTDIGKKHNKKFKIESYFEKCLGRMTAKWDWSNNGKIYKRYTGNEYYFEIEFEYAPYLVDLVKNIPGRRYNSAARTWAIPLSSEEHVINFGRANRFFFDFGENNYSNNPHLAKYERQDIPNGIRFCEGRIAVNKDTLLNKHFWWCANEKCLQNCETDHLAPRINKTKFALSDLMDSESEGMNAKPDYNELTLLDFLKIFNIYVDENSNYGFFPNGRYYQLVSQINRFNRLLDKLYCQACDDILFPTQSSNFAAYTVVRFSCQNSNCKEHGKEVYLNHCLDGKCNNIIDSRISRQCENGLYICNVCGGCCSHDMLNRRLNNLRVTGGFIHQNLVESVENKLGHKEKNEYFCYKCADLMTEVIDDINHGPRFFKCLKCAVEYHPSSNIKRPHLHLRRPNYPIIRLSNIKR
jgi:hypothetical protein